MSGSERSLHSCATIQGCPSAGCCNTHFRSTLVVCRRILAQEGWINCIITQQGIGQSGILTKNALQGRETRAVVVAIPRLDTEISQSEPLSPVDWGGFPARDFELLFPEPACTLCPTILPRRLAVSRQDSHAIGLSLLREIAFEFQARVEHQDVWKAIDPNPCVHKGVPRVFGSLGVVSADYLDLLERGAPADHVQEEAGHAIGISGCEQIDSDNVVEAIGFWHS